MTLNITTSATPAANLSVTLQRVGDEYYWNDSAEAWQAAPSFADRRIDLTEGTVEEGGSFVGGNSGDLGDAGWLRVRVHDLDEVNDRTIEVLEYEVLDGQRVGSEQIAAAVWDSLQTQHTTVGTFGYYLDAAVSGSSGAGSGSTGDAQVDLTIARDNIAKQLADMTASPKPTYDVDGQRVEWEAHFRALSEELDRLTLALQALEPFEFRTTGEIQ